MAVLCSNGASVFVFSNYLKYIFHVKCEQRNKYAIMLSYIRDISSSMTGTLLGRSGYHPYKAAEKSMIYKIENGITHAHLEAAQDNQVILRIGFQQKGWLWPNMSLGEDYACGVKEKESRTSLVAQQIGIHLPMQGKLV